MSFDELPAAWTVWNDEADGPSVVVYRPDVFDTVSFPPACLPTLYLTTGSPDRPPQERQRGDTPTWRVALLLEPEVEVTSRTFETRAAAVTGVTELATAFARGDIDYRGAYQVPREPYLDRLDELTGRDA